MSGLALSCAFEPYVNPNFGDYVRRAMSYQPPDVTIFTNGILLDAARIRELIDAQVHRLTISLDGVRRETFEVLRRGAKFDKLVDILHLICRMKQEAGSTRPKLAFQFVLLYGNIREVPELVPFAAQCGVEEIYFLHRVEWTGISDTSPPLHRVARRLTNAMLRRAKHQARRYGVAIVAAPYFQGRTPLHRAARAIKRWAESRRLPLCSQPWEQMNFTVTGEIVPCFGWMPKFRVGNIAEQTLEEIWNSEPYRRLRAGLLRQREPEEVCVNCHYFKPNLGKEMEFEPRELRFEDLLASNRLFKEDAQGQPCYGGGAVEMRESRK
jgi:radical SAM protein with 4Fe4S-binding SPASM domain